MSYAVYGYPVSEVEQNAAGSTLEQQQQTPPERVIYVADEESEAVHIVNAGGYIDSNNVWQVATRYALSDGAPATQAAPLRKPDAATAPLRDALAPDNSTAEIDPNTGAVRTDVTKKPLKFAPGDVAAIAEEEADIPKKRNIISPGDKGNLGNQR